MPTTLYDGPAYDGPATPRLTLVFAHGAGAAMDTVFMSFFARGLAALDYGVLRFEFPYMAATRQDGKRRPPDRPDVLRQAFARAADEAKTKKRVLMGKSMGGRFATMLANDLGAQAAIALGYPFHPPGKPEQLRTAHLETLQTPCLLVQGERDPFGTRDEVAGYKLAKQVSLHWAPDGNHDLTPRKASGLTAQDNWRAAIKAVDGFLSAL